MKHYEILERSDGMWIALVGNDSTTRTASQRRREALVLGPFATMNEAIKACDETDGSVPPEINVLPCMEGFPNDEVIAAALARANQAHWNKDSQISTQLNSQSADA